MTDNEYEEQELANGFQLSSVPIIVVLKEGKVVNSSVGYRPMEQIEALLK